MTAERSSHRAARRVAFWMGVGAVAVLANFFAELTVDALCERTKCPPGLAVFTAYTHKGAN